VSTWVSVGSTLDVVTGEAVGETATVGTAFVAGLDPVLERSSRGIAARIIIKRLIRVNLYFLKNEELVGSIAFS